MSGGDTTQVLTFTLGGEDYCVPIDYVAEIVDEESIRSLPDTAPHVEGITDLRGQTTTIINPAALLDLDTRELLTDGGQAQSRIIVLDSETLGTDGATGWLVSDVDEVTDVDEDVLDAEGVADTDLLRGLITDDDGFTLWLDPHEFTA